MGDAKEASSILAAVRKALQDLIAMNKALAKNCDDPVLKARFIYLKTNNKLYLFFINQGKNRYDAAAAAAQKTLDEVVPLLAEEVEQLLRGPTSNAALRRLHAMVEDLQRAAHSMVMVLYYIIARSVGVFHSHWLYRLRLSHPQRI